MITAVILRLTAILMFALFAPLPVAACAMQASGGCGGSDQIVLTEGVSSITPAAAPQSSSCCTTSECQCGEEKTLACGHQQPLSGAACLCGCTQLPPEHVPAPVNSSARADLFKVLMRTELLPRLVVVAEPRSGFSGHVQALRPGAEQLFLLNLSLRT